MQSNVKHIVWPRSWGHSPLLPFYLISRDWAGEPAISWRGPMTLVGLIGVVIDDHAAVADDDLDGACLVSPLGLLLFVA